VLPEGVPAEALVLKAAKVEKPAKVKKPRGDEGRQHAVNRNTRTPTKTPVAARCRGFLLRAA
jgi:hypothetical protein